MKNLLGEENRAYMERPMVHLRREVGRVYVDPLTWRRKELGIPIDGGAMVMCRHCGAFVRLIGVPPETEPGQPFIALYYPLQYCPVCGVDVGRALGIELVRIAPMGAPTYHLITCQQCLSKLRYKTQALAPQYLTSLQCPVCAGDLGVQGLEVEALEVEPWPIVGEELEEIPWKPIIIVGGAFAILFTAVGIGHFINQKKK